ncbi:MAG TPA: thermosome subunit alpha [Candidatus Nanoarchaeia archaeon]|nr:thermosome subunit alpha [Candidatus Nanoarchaeia archaeon]
MANQIQPIFILPQDTQRSTGKDAQRNNIAAAKAVAETVRTTLGPKGMDKMLVDSMGDIVVTNDGVTILEEMAIEHPTAKMIVEVAKTQEKEVGDGTTTAVVLAGELLKQAEHLLDDNVHPTVIAKGYRLAAERSKHILNELAENVTEKDLDILKKIAITAMTGKGAESAKDHLADLAVKAVIQIKDAEGINLDNIKVEKVIGGGIETSELLEGIVLDKERVNFGMPKQIKNAKLALLDVALEVKSPETDTKIEISNPEQLEAFLDREERLLKEMVKRVKDSTATVVVCQKGIDDLAQHYLAKEGIYAVRRVKKSDLDKLALATTAKIVSSLKDLSSEDLGHAGLVEEIKVGDELMTYIRECKNPKAVTLLVKGGTEHVAAEVERAIKDALGDLAAALKSGKVVGGAGAIEVELAKRLRHFATSLSGKEQLAVNAFATSLEIIPRTLAENAGLDPIDLLTELKAKHDTKEGKWFGIDVFEGKVNDAWKAGVIEPLKIKTQAVQSASEVAELILRIDDVIASGGNKGGGMPHSGMPPQGMPGMDY